MADVTETRLPGVGVRHEFTTGAGERLAVLTHRTGRREIALYAGPDPDVCTTVLHLDADDARTLVELLGGGSLTEATTGVQRLAGVAIDWLPITEDSALAGASIADGQLRTRTGASVVAVVRGETTIAAPGPDERLVAGDTVVAVGTSEGLRSLRELLGA
jgi:TrkA domain protein